MTHARQSRAPGKSGAQTHFHNMLESHNASNYQGEGVLGNLMKLGVGDASRQTSGIPGAPGSRFGEPKSPADSKMGARVHNFMNSDVSQGQQVSRHANMPLSKIKMNFNPIQEDQAGEMNASNNARGTRGGPANGSAGLQKQFGGAQPNKLEILGAAGAVPNAKCAGQPSAGQIPGAVEHAVEVGAELTEETRRAECTRSRVGVASPASRCEPKCWTTTDSPRSTTTFF